jgi:hypothetical protein
MLSRSDALDIDIDTDLFSLSQQRELISGYVTDHLQVNGAEGTEWAEMVGQLTAINIDGVALVASGAWILERLDVAAHPFSSIENATVDHLGLIGILLAAAAAAVLRQAQGYERAARPRHAATDRTAHAVVGDAHYRPCESTWND